MIQIGVPLGGNVTVASNMSYLKKGWPDRSFLLLVNLMCLCRLIDWNQCDNLYQTLCKVMKYFR